MRLAGAGSWDIPLAAIATLLGHAALALAQTRLAGDGGVPSALALYFGASLLLLAAYLRVISRSESSPSRADLRVLVVVPLVVHAGWLMMRPTLAIDVYSYLVDAAHVAAGLSPYQHPVRSAEGTALGAELAAYGWRPVHGTSPYGPLWMWVMRLIGPVAHDVELATRVLKGLAFAATVAAAWLIYRTSPHAPRIGAFTAFWWNPAVIIEGSGDGHNDLLLIAWVILAVAALRRGMPVVSTGALTVAVLIKWVPLLFGPAFMAYGWRRGWWTRRTVALGGCVAGALTLAAFWPVWVGSDTFNGILRLADARVVASTVGALSSLDPDLGVHPLLLRVTSCMVAAVVVCTAWGSRSVDALVHGCAVAAVVYLTLASPLFWAWYLLLPIALFSVTRNIPMVLVLTVASRAVAPLDVLRVRGEIAWMHEVWLTTILGAWLPLAVLLWRAVRRARGAGSEREKSADSRSDPMTP